MKICILKRPQKLRFLRRTGKTSASQRYRLVLPRMTLFSLCLILRVKDVKATEKTGLDVKATGKTGLVI